MANNGRIRLSVSTVNRTYELSGITHVTPFRKYGKHSTGTSTYSEPVPTASCSPESPFLRFVVSEPSRMKSVRTEGCHVGLFREFVGTACCTYGQSNTTSQTDVTAFPPEVILLPNQTVNGAFWSNNRVILSPGRSYCPGNPIWTW